MEIGAFFILVIVVVALGIGGGLLYAVAGGLRRRKLDPSEDKLDGGQDGAEERPQHLEVESEQRAHFVGTP
jgi:hypothetical protein